MKKSSWNWIFLIVVWFSVLMTIISSNIKFLSTGYVIVMGLGLLVPAVAIIIYIRQRIKKGENL
ncbi:MAG: hypothetical protein FWD66_10680 [Paludibacter sp.]|nr:hypothetical protein [Paludibacter sp.]